MSWWLICSAPWAQNDSLLIRVRKWHCNCLLGYSTCICFAILVLLRFLCLLNLINCFPCYKSQLRWPPFSRNSLQVGYLSMIYYSPCLSPILMKIASWSQVVTMDCGLVGLHSSRAAKHPSKFFSSLCIQFITLRLLFLSFVHSWANSIALFWLHGLGVCSLEWLVWAPRLFLGRLCHCFNLFLLLVSIGYMGRVTVLVCWYTLVVTMRLGVFWYKPLFVIHSCVIVKYCLETI